MLQCLWLVESVDGVELQIQRLPISYMRINPFVVQGSAVYGIGGEPSPSEPKSLAAFRSR